jgi:Uma2 family endonuclease
MANTTAIERQQQLLNGDFEIFYPSGDGEPMGETDVHVNQILLLKACLDLHYEQRQDVSVSANIFLYYQEGDPKKRVSPDVMVTLGVPRRDRRSFFVWKEGKAPDVIFEITSDSSIWYDLKEKLQIYQQLQIQEYFVFNPLIEPLTLENTLAGYRLANQVYRTIEQKEEAMISECLQLELALHGTLLRLRDPKTGQWIPTLGEANARTREEAEARQRAEQEAQREAEARQRAEQEAQREAEARQQVEQKLREMEEKLKALQNKKR